MRLTLLCFLFFLKLTISYCQNNTQLHLKVQITKSNTNQKSEEIERTSQFSSINDLRSEFNNITESYYSEGYVDLISNLEKKNDSLYIGKILLGKQFSYLQLDISEIKNTKSLFKDKGINIKNDSILIETAFAKAYLEELSASQANSGNPFSIFKIVEITKGSNNTLRAKLTLEENQIRTVDKITINGYDEFPRAYLKNYIKLKSGNIFNKDEITTQSSKLDALTFVEEIKPPEVLFTNDSTNVFFYLKRRNTNNFDGFLGFQTDDDNKLQLTGYLDLLLQNNLNLGETFRLNYKSDGNDQTQFSTQLKIPYILSSPFGAEATLKLFRQDSTFSSNEVIINSTYNFKESHTLKLGLTSLGSQDLTEDETTENLNDISKTSITTSYGFLKRQRSSLNPILTSFDITGGIGTRKSDFPDEQQFFINTTAFHNFKLWEHHNLYIKNATSYLDSENYTINELFRIGGINSIRGFDENSIFANWFNTLNTEYQYSPTNNLYIHSVFDIGYFENEITNTESFLTSFGIGTGILTEAGLLRVVLANGTFGNNEFDFNNTKLSLSLFVIF